MVTRIKRPVTPVPKDLEEAAKFLNEIGHEQRKIDKIKTTLNDEIKRLEDKVMVDVKVHEERTTQLVEGLFAFAESQRDKLTDGGKHKTVKVPTGIFGWRLTPLSVSIRKTQLVLKALKELGLNRFIRVKTEEVINKGAMIKESEIAKTVKGVTISQHEEFVVKPIELEVEIASRVQKLKKKVSKEAAKAK